MNNLDYFLEEDFEREGLKESLFLWEKDIEIWQEYDEWVKNNKKLDKKYGKYKGFTKRVYKFADGKHSIKLPRKRKKALQSKQRGIRQFKQ